MKLKLPIAFVVSLIAASSLLRAEIPVKSGEKMAFLGDSITQAGFGKAGGYVQLIGAGLAANGVKVEIIGAGVSGHKSNQMLERLERDVLSKNPQWMTLSCGVNDVWHGAKGIPLEEYQQNITSIVDKAQAAGIKVIILTSTMITEDSANPNNQKLALYNEFLRSLAKEKKCLLADLNAEMQAALAEAAKPPANGAKKNVLTSDGVHMAFPGDMMMAIGVLKGMGFDSLELSKAKKAWLDLPNTNPVALKVDLSQRQADELEKLAQKQNTSKEDLLKKELDKVVNSLLRSGKP